MNKTVFFLKTIKEKLGRKQNKQHNNNNNVNNNIHSTNINAGANQNIHGVNSNMNTNTTNSNHMNNTNLGRTPMNGNYGGLTHQQLQNYQRNQQLQRQQQQLVNQQNGGDFYNQHYYGMQQLQQGQRQLGRQGNFDQEMENFKFKQQQLIKYQQNQKKKNEKNKMNNLITITTGLTRETKKKYLGGRGNKEPLPLHTIKLQNYNTRIPGITAIEDLIVRGALFGFNKRNKSSEQVPVELQVFDDQFFTNMGGVWQATFSDIVVKYASHNNGQWLFVRFYLLDTGKGVPIAVVDTAKFKTITKRGIEKKNKKLNKLNQMYNCIKEINPPVGPMFGGTLVKIIGKDFKVTHVDRIIVKFGTAKSNEVHCARRNLIICETPSSLVEGEVKVYISFNSGKSFLQGFGVFTYITHSSHDGVEKYINYILNK